ncbi:MAG TPA: hypothetical protein VNH63_09035 [Gemmatimonadales bacterium]|nr:hypothetical protein [Gemmatimonadales bacterium]
MTRHLRLVSCAILLFAGPLTAQRSALREVRDGGGSGGGLSLMIVQPVGQFKQFVNGGAGVGLAAVPALDRDGIVGLRIEGEFLAYGYTSEPVTLSGGGYAIPAQAQTWNLIGSVQAGPQLTFGDGPARLYGFLTGGVVDFATTTSLQSDCGCELASYGDGHDLALAWQAGGGMMFALGRGRHPAALDLGARYLRNGTVTYGTTSGGTLRFVRSEANAVVYHIGLSFGF